MLWLSLAFILFVAQYAHAAAAKQRPNHPRIAFNTAVTAGCAFIGANLFLSAFYGSNRTWGAPVNIQKTSDGVAKLLGNLETLDALVRRREAEVERLRQLIASMAAHEKYIYSRFYDKLIHIEQASHLNLTLLQRLSPEGNLYLPDNSKTTEALVQLAAFEASLRQDVLEGLLTPEEAEPVLAILKEVTSHLSTGRVYKNVLIQRLIVRETAALQLGYTEVQFEEPAEPILEAEDPTTLPPALPVPDTEDPTTLPPASPLPEAEDPTTLPLPPAAPSAEQPAVIQPLPEGAELPPLPSFPNIEPEVPEAPEALPPTMNVVPYSHGMDIPDAEGKLLWSGHKLTGDAREARRTLANAALLLVDQLSELVYYRQAMRHDEGSAFYRASASQVPITFLFMDKQARPLVKEGDPIYACRLGPFWCRRVGLVRVLYSQLQQAPHPFSGRPVDGFLVEATLTEPTAARTRVLYVHRPFFD